MTEPDTPGAVAHDVLAQEIARHCPTWATRPARTSVPATRVYDTTSQRTIATISATWVATGSETHYVGHLDEPHATATTLLTRAVGAGAHSSAPATTLADIADRLSTTTIPTDDSRPQDPDHAWAITMHWDHDDTDNPLGRPMLTVTHHHRTAIVTATISPDAQSPTIRIATYDGLLLTTTSRGTAVRTIHDLLQDRTQDRT